MTDAVPDASALLAYLFDEPGADAVERVLAGTAYMTTVNFCEVLSKLDDRGVPSDQALEQLRDRGVMDALELEDFTLPLAVEAARLRSAGRPLGLSLGDRACLALARVKGCPAVTADSVWTQIPGAAVELIR